MVCTCGQGKPHPAKSCYESARAVPITSVLAHYGIDISRMNGTNMRSRICPFPNHKGKGTDLSIHSDGRFQCFSCDARGKGPIQFVAKAEGITDAEAATRINEWFTAAQSPARQPVPVQEAAPVQPDPKPSRNIPLAEKFKAKGWDGMLKGIDPGHPYLAERGFEPDLCAAFGVGYYEHPKLRPYMNGRIVFPIHNPLGELVGYAGRLVRPEVAWTPTDPGTKKPVEGYEPPRWQLPGEFHSSLELYNLHRLEGSTCTIVESFWGVLACYRAGVPNAIALMGRNLSEEQAALLGRFKRVTLLLDSGDPGRTATVKIGKALLEMPFETVRVIRIPDGTQPDTLPPDDLANILM